MSVDAYPTALREALAFIESGPERQIRLADIARAGGLSPRAIQLAFRRHLDTTPTLYLRQVRLSRAHEQLLAGSHADGLTVTRVALDWGFANPGRFASYYRSRYGNSPGETLAGRGGVAPADPAPAPLVI